MVERIYFQLLNGNENVKVLLQNICCRGFCYTCMQNEMV